MENGEKCLRWTNSEQLSPSAAIQALLIVGRFRCRPILQSIQHINGVSQGVVMLNVQNPLNHSPGSRIQTFEALHLLPRQVHVPGLSPEQEEQETFVPRKLN